MFIVWRIVPLHHIRINQSFGTLGRAVRKNFNLAAKRTGPTFVPCPACRGAGGLHGAIHALGYLTGVCLVVVALDYDRLKFANERISWLGGHYWGSLGGYGPTLH